MNLDRKLEIAGISKERLCDLIKQKNIGCCSVLDITPSYEVNEYRKGIRFYNGYSSCVSNIGYLLQGTKYYADFLIDLANSNIPCTKVREYTEKLLTMKSAYLMETE